mmetsp:Transcript_19090/g.44629  ORF Transcript_19090/g.44629 Transcript_19090/m.44629 type:complete len:948 (+) Transcript_19090:57-2900(+)
MVDSPVKSPQQASPRLPRSNGGGSQSEQISSIRRHPNFSAAEEEMEKEVELGSYVVDICSGQRAVVLAMSKTHYKVRYVQESRHWTQRRESEKVAIVQKESFRVLTDLWEGMRAESSANRQPMKAVKSARVRSSQQKDVASEPQNCSSSPSKMRGTKSLQSTPRVGKQWQQAQALPALLACYAAKHNILEKTPRESKMWASSAGDVVEQESSPRRRKTNPIPEDEGTEHVRRFKRLLKANYGGSLGVAWRLALDVRGAGRIGFLEFVRGGRTLGFTGNYRKLWDTLTDGSDPKGGTIGFEQIDPEGAVIMDDFRKLLEECDLPVEDLWEKHLDAGNGRCSQEEFSIAMSALGFPVEKSQSLFQMLDLGMEQDLTFDELEMAGLRRRVVQQEPSQRELRNKRDEEERQRIEADFKAFLLRTYNNLVRAWRLGLDFDDDGRLTFVEFCKSCKAIGFHGRLKTLWHCLDEEGHGFVTLKSIDAEAYTQLESLRHLIEENYRTLDDVWERVFDRSHKGRCSKDEFASACATLGWNGNVVKMFNWLDVENRACLTIEVMEFLGIRRRVITSETASQRLHAKQEKDRAESVAVLGNFRHFLVCRYGNMVRAWRLEFDPDGDGKLQFTEFCRACREIGFHGNLKALWLSLDADDTGYIDLAELDPEAVSFFEEFEGILRTFFDDLDAAWWCCLDPDYSEKCSLEEFEHACRLIGFTKSAKRLFTFLDIRNDGHILVSDLQFLGLPRSESKESASQLASASAERTCQAFEDFLRSEFHSLVRAWRKGFASSEPTEHLAEAVSAQSFCNRCRELGFSGNFLKLWRGLHGLDDRHSRMDNHSERGSRFSHGRARTFPMTVSLKELDPEVYQELASFRSHCESKFRTADDSWWALLQACLEPDFDARLRKVEFMQAVRIIGFQGDAEVVFESCDLEEEHTMSVQSFRFLRIGASSNDQ